MDALDRKPGDKRKKKEDRRREVKL
jgi:hypothetical protein